MNPDHITGAIAAYAGAFCAQLFVNARTRKFIRDHLDGIYRRLGRVEGHLSITPSPFPSTDIGPEPVSGLFKKP
jgi:hypothetical protein